MADLAKDWQTITCDCGSDRFIVVTKLKVKDQAGLVPEPHGWECQSCRQHADVNYLIQRARMRMKKAELASLEAEISAGPAPKPATVAEPAPTRR